MVAHSHQDAGWMKTADEYYIGQNNGIIHCAVRTIYDGVLDELQKDPKRKFTFADIKFMTMWYKN
jgi:lysosomal alpha-mannosidase